MRKKITALAVAAIGVAMLGAGSTYAAYTDTETAEPVLVRAGTLDLVLSDGEGQATAPVTFADMVPGPPLSLGGYQPSEHHYFVRLTNDGSLPGTVEWSTTSVSELDHGCNDAERDARDATCGDGRNAGELGKQLFVSFSSLNGPDCTGAPVGTDSPYNPAFNRDYQPVFTGEGSAFVLGASDTRCVRIDVHFPSGARNNLAQSDSSTFRLSFRLDQA